MSWIEDELDSRRVDEKKKDTKGSSGTAYPYKVRVKVNGILMLTVVHAENQRRAKAIAEKLFGKGKLQGLPTRK